jgi:hypothetical protein
MGLGPANHLMLGYRKGKLAGRICRVTFPAWQKFPNILG